MTLYTGDAIEVLAALPDRTADCVVTSPPYWGLRDYGTATWTGGQPDCPHVPYSDRKITRRLRPGSAAPAGIEPDPHGAVCARCGAVREDRQYGLEPTLDGYLNQLRAVFQQLARVLARGGTAWLNLGDSYATPTRAATATPAPGSPEGGTAGRPLAAKDLIGLPWRAAFALQADGWIIRNCVVWHKPNAMPESVTDRLSNRYELLFLLVRDRRYHFDLDPIRVPLARPEALTEGIMIGSEESRHGATGAARRTRGANTYGSAPANAFPAGPPGAATAPTGQRHTSAHPRGRNPGDVWTISTRPLRAAHFAAFPIDLPLRCIAAGCRPGGLVLDPFSGAATTGLAARQLDRDYLGIDLNPAFHDLALTRLGLHPPTGSSDDETARRAA
ncbi:site-specific DNA-methyltransferase [Frankia sp. AgB1.9]|nr:site-specific DNA-methyltransferase [Frankia sp. AgW1.1]MBL7546586.1 site-specific DNA-methyltransferase [Frankia sp. AgB1.9]